MRGSDNEPIDLARFAEVSAHLRHFPADAGAEILGRLGLDEVGWRAAKAHWLAARRAELDAGGGEITRRFGKMFGEALGRLAKLSPEITSIGAPASVDERPAKHDPVAAERPPVEPAPLSSAPIVAVDRAHPTLGSTLPLGARLPLERFPFRPRAPGVSETPRAEARPKRAARSGETVGLSVAVDPAADGVAELTLPQYASLRVDLEVASGPREAILARYGLDEAGRLALDARWRSRFEADPLLRMMFAKAYATYLGWLRRAPG